MDYMTMPISDHAHPKIIEIAFSFIEFAPACKKLVHSIYSILRYSQFYHDQTGPVTTPIFYHAHPNFF